jgi:hypothetical protein
MSATAPASSAITEAADRMLAAEPSPRPRLNPTAVRIPPDLLTWYERHAEELTRETGSKVATHRALVIALEAYRAAVDGRPRRANLPGGPGGRRLVPR